ncbi:hypothetical protein C0995_012839 [Termitomyces sp. Mi166|nr:hypothetical protein C0995_012839 [Termitomyces sp. Mi166\
MARVQRTFHSQELQCELAEHPHQVVPNSSPIADPRFDFKGLEIAHTNIPITNINLVVHFEHEGVCDERSDLSFRPKRGDHRDPPRANHFSLWFALGGTDMVVIHITQPNYPFNPCATDARAYLSDNTAIVRIFSDKTPSALDIGCVYQETEIRQDITIAHIVGLIDESKRQEFLFRTVDRQKVGCRHWIYTIAKDLERAGITPRGYADKVLRHLETYYSRGPVKTKSGRWVGDKKWAARPEFQCPAVQTGILPVVERR